jgi:chorismate synthase
MAFRYTTSGESHGPELTAIIEGVPSRLRLERSHIDRDLGRRQLGYGRGGRMRIETDTGKITAGVRHGYTLGSPIAITVANQDFKNWTRDMGADPRGRGPHKQAVTVPRPGHADLAGIQKFSFDDVRNVLERASARETAARVAAGAVARRLLDEFGISVVSHVNAIGKVKASTRLRRGLEDFANVDKSPVRCLDDAAVPKMKTAIDEARKQGESLGGIFEVIAFGLPPGLGSYATGPERLGGRLAAAVMSIPAIKGAEIGDGFRLAATPGSKAHDEIFFAPKRGFYRKTNHAGGLEGGMTTGEPLVVRACMKPIPTLTTPLRSTDIVSGGEIPAHKERSDVCAVPAAAVVGEAMVCAVLARAMLEKFGGDCIDDTKESFLAYLRRLRKNWPPA